MSFGETSEAWPFARDRHRDVRRLGRVDPEGLPVVAPLVRATTGDGAICFDTSTDHYKGLVAQIG